MQTVNDFLKKVEVYYLATIDGDQPRVRPFGTINLFENKLYIMSGKKKDVAKQIAANPKVELSGFDGKTWIRVAATLVYDDRKEAQDSMLDAYPHLKAMYPAEEGNVAVYYLKDATATYYSMDGAPQVVKF
ncbi:MAG: pyridoxamine 5'-phosphate oxidase family protein [Peptococcaceae bacterium]|nr:pyridoxamine 5'-phosphate oxidase family protein [Peptococcaceae bacterium]